jgi:hypothetical protein
MYLCREKKQAMIHTTENATDTIKWETSDADVATVNNGAITGVSVGTATISVSNVAGTIKKEITVTVGPAYTDSEKAEFNSIMNSQSSLSPAPISLEVEPWNVGISLVDGPTTGQKAISIPKGSLFWAQHGIAANGGGNKVNEYTILMDFKLPEGDASYCFYQTNLNNSDEVAAFGKASQ